MSKKKLKTVDIVTLAVLVAMSVVFGRFLTIILPIFKLETAFIPMAIAAYLFGPFGGMLVAGLGDLIGAIAFPVGAYCPYFTLTAALSGFIFGLVLKGRYKFTKTLLSVILTQLISTLALNSVFLN